MVNTRNCSENGLRSKKNEQQITVSVQDLTKLIETIVNSKIEKLTYEIMELQNTNKELVHILSQNENLFNKNIKKSNMNHSILQELHPSEINTSVSTHTTNAEEALNLSNESNKGPASISPNTRYKTKASKQNNKTHSHKPIVGSGEQTTDIEITAAPKRLWIYVGNLAPTVTTEKLNNFLNKNLPNRKFIVENLRNDDTSSSFKIGADFDLEETLYNPEFWPKSVIIKRFQFFRRNNFNRRNK